MSRSVLRDRAGSAPGDRTSDTARLRALGLGLAQSAQSDSAAIELLVGAAAGSAQLLRAAARELTTVEVACKESQMRAALLLDAAAIAVDDTAAPPEDAGEMVTVLLDNAALFDRPDDYRAGVLDTLEALGMEPESPVS